MRLRSKWWSVVAGAALVGSSLAVAIPAVADIEEPQSGGSTAQQPQTASQTGSIPEVGPQSEDITTREVNLLNINDFHGRIVGELNDDKTGLKQSPTVNFAYTVESLRRDFGAENTLFLSAGDNVGATVFASSLQKDVPTIELLNTLGLGATAAGNHEFDGGWEDTKRIEDLLDAPILGANVFYKDTGAPAFPPYAILEAATFKVAVVGAVTVETPTLVSPAGVANLRFTDPVEAVNETVATLLALDPNDRPDLIVAEYHEGLGSATPTVEEGVAASATFAKIVNETSADVDVIFNGHTHQQYTYAAPVPGHDDRTRPVVQTGQYGQNVGQVVLDVAADGTVHGYEMRLVNVAETVGDMTLAEMITGDATLTEVYRIVLDAEIAADEVGSEPAGELSAPITRAYTEGTWDSGFFELTDGSKEDRGQASAMATLVGNALVGSLSELPNAPDFAVLNPGGLRTDLYPDEDGVITVAQARAVLPFNNELTIVTMTGEQIKTMLEQQWQRDQNGEVPSRGYLQLGFSDNVQYTYAEIADPQIDGATRGVVDSIWIDGELVTPESTFRAGTFSFLSSGGDNFRVFEETQVAETGYLDWSAFLDYIEDNSPLAPDYARAGVRLEGVHTDDIFQVGSELGATAANLDVPSVGAPVVTDVVFSLSGEGSQTVAAVNGAATVTFPVVDPGVPAVNFEVRAEPTGTRAAVPVVVAQAEPEKAPTLTLDEVRVAAGGTVVVSGEGWEPETEVVLTLHSKPVLLGKITVGADGKFSVKIKIPSTTAPGDHTLKAVAERLTASAKVHVLAGSSGGETPGTDGKGGGSSRSGSLPVTGASVLLMLILGAGSVAAGVGVNRKTRK